MGALAQIRPNHVTFGTALGCCGSSWESAQELMQRHLAETQNGRDQTWQGNFLNTGFIGKIWEHRSKV